MVHKSKNGPSQVQFDLMNAIWQVFFPRRISHTGLPPDNMDLNWALEGGPVHLIEDTVSRRVASDYSRVDSGSNDTSCVVNIDESNIDEEKDASNNGNLR